MFLCGCVNTPVNTPGPDKPQNIEGFYFCGDGISAFQPCYSRQVYWLRGSKENLDTMKNYYNQQETEEKHADIYASLIVENIGHQADRQSITYDETLKLTEIVYMDDSDNHPDCLPLQDAGKQ